MNREMNDSFRVLCLLETRDRYFSSASFSPAIRLMSTRSPLSIDCHEYNHPP